MKPIKAAVGATLTAILFISAFYLARATAMTPHPVNEAHDFAASGLGTMSSGDCEIDVDQATAELTSSAVILVTPYFIPNGKIGVTVIAAPDNTIHIYSTDGSDSGSVAWMIVSY